MSSKELRRKLPIGIQTFSEIVSGGNIYVDKTDLVYQLVNGSKFNFLSRPRRFGKSLLQSTIKAYFQGKKELFEGLVVADLEKNWESCPVFHIDLSAEDYKQGVHVLDSKLNFILTQAEKIYGRIPEEDSFSLRFAGVIERAYKKENKQVVILIDEYDKPLMDAMEKSKELYDEFHSRLAAFYAALKPSDPYIRFALLTGITKIANLNIFSGLNQLKDITLDKKYASICGITQTELEANFKPEIKALADDKNLTYDNALQKLKQEYNGYRFTDVEVTVYNPYSTLCALDEKSFRNFWFSTGTPSSLIEEIRHIRLDVKDFENKISSSAMNISSYRPGSGDVIPLLFQAGYLTIKGIKKSGNYLLGFPNGEVRGSFLNFLVNYFASEKSLGVFDAGALIDDLYDNELENLFKRLTAFYSSIPFDLSNKTEEHYQTAFYILFTLLGQKVHVEEHTAIGSTDAVIELEDAIYIFEFKIDGNGTAQDALKQIEERGYATKYENNPSETRKIVKLGVVFNTETRTIGEWAVGE